MNPPPAAAAAALAAATATASSPGHRRSRGQADDGGSLIKRFSDLLMGAEEQTDGLINATTLA